IEGSDVPQVRSHRQAAGGQTSVDAHQRFNGPFTRQGLDPSDSPSLTSATEVLNRSDAHVGYDRHAPQRADYISIQRTTQYFLGKNDIEILGSTPEIAKRAYLKAKTSAGNFVHCKLRITLGHTCLETALDILFRRHGQS